MSYLSIGANDVTEQEQAIKDKLSSKDAQIAAHESKLMKQVAEIDELKSRLNDTLYKLTDESKRVLALEADLGTRTEQFRNEKVLAQNTQSTLNATQEQLKSKDLETKELQSILDSISSKSGQDLDKVKREKAAADKRIRELEYNLQQLSAASTTPIPTPGKSRGRSSSLSNVKISHLEQELADLRSQLAKSQDDAASASRKVAQTQKELIQIGNEKMAMERKLASEVSDLRSQLDDKEEELGYLRNDQGDRSREGELLQRIEEDEAKIAALELMLTESQETKALETRLRAAETKLRQQMDKASRMEAAQVELVAEKEKALDRLEQANDQISQLNTWLSDKTSIETGTRLDASTAAGVQRILDAVDRIRGERDDLRRDLGFLQLEHQFALESLRSKETALAMATSTANLPSPSPTNDQFSKLKDRTHLITRGLAIVIQHATAESLGYARLLEKAEQLNTERLEDLHARNGQIQHLEERLEVGSQHVSQLAGERDDLHSRLASFEQSSESLKSDLREKGDNLEHYQNLLHEATKSYQDLEAERDSLSLQVVNLTTDLATAQEDLASAESRYSSLQFQQLSSMSNHQATQTYKEHIHDLEMRVMRRNEQIGIHQHDIKRLETNLRLQEERVSELTSEVEVLEAERCAMVEDCADARDRRDEVLSRVEGLEDQVEGMENSLEFREREIEGLVQCLFGNMANRRESIRTNAQHVERIQVLQNKLQDAERLLNEHAGDLEIVRRQSTASVQSSLEIEQALTESREAVDALQEIKRQLEEELANMSLRLEAQTSELSTLQDCNDQLQDETTMSRQRISDLSQTIDTLLASVEEKKSEISQAGKDVIDLEQRLQEALGEQLRIRADSEMEHRRLEDMHREQLDQVQQHREAAEARIHSAGDEKAQLEAQLAELNKQLAIDEQSKQDRDSDILKLRESLQLAACEAEQAKKSRDGLQAELEAARTELAAAEELQRQQIDDSTTARDMLQRQVLELETRITEQASQQQINADKVRELEEAAQDLEARHADEIAALEEELEANSEQLKQIDVVRSELDHVRTDLDSARSLAMSGEDEKTKIANENATLSAEVQKLLSLKQHIESQLKDHENKIKTLTDSLQQAKEKLEVSEKTSQQSSANLTMQVIHHQQEITSLRKELATWKAKPNLDIIVAELEQKNSDLEDILKAKCQEIDENDDKILEILQEKKKALAKVDSLTRKIQLLQTKLAAARTTALSDPQAPSSSAVLAPSVGKALSLDPTAIAAPQPANAITPASTSKEPFVQPRVRPAASAPAASIPIPDYIPAPLPSRSRSPSRVVSGSSSLIRPKTPDRNSAGTIVFRAKTPEQRNRQVSRVSEALISEAVAGKKRRMPDDYDAGDNQPPQVFTPDSIPAKGSEYTHVSGNSRSSTASRARTLSNPSQSGFTPVRRRPAAEVNDRPMMGIPSPKRSIRPEQPPMKEDENNHPVSSADTARPIKKGWLGKIRGGGVSRP